MYFNSLEYAVLLLSAFAGFWLLGNHRRPRVLLLLTASYLFYASWNAKYLGLIFFSSSWDFFIGQRLARTVGPTRRKVWLAMSLVVNLGILCVFKYFNFFAGEVATLFGQFGWTIRPIYLEVLLPVGISFYTFQTLSYTIDVYRRRLEPAADYFEYLLFVSFFPQLVAGPIVRASQLLPQIGRTPRLTVEQGSRAVFRIGAGLVKKVAIADFVGAHLVDPVFSNPQMYSSVETMTAVYGYAFQIYADFSAYSDIAIGSAALLGFHIPENFDLPYRAANLQEFWRRWHISLSTWLKDYLYIPLGGSRGGAVRTAANLMITMLLGGLWHGAAATFVIWGAIHGVALILTRAVQRLLPARNARPSAGWHLLKVLFTFHLVCASWVFFRSPTLSAAWTVFASIGTLSTTTANLSWPVLALLSAAVVSHYLPKKWIEDAFTLFHRAPAPVQAALLIGALLVVQAIARTEIAPFIYFQF